MSIIKSLLDTDWYSFTQSYAIIRTMQRLGRDMPIVLYRFKCRNKADLLSCKKKIEQEIKEFQRLRFTAGELTYIQSQDLFDQSFPIDLTTMNLSEISVNVFERDNEFHLEVEGPWFPAILFEVPLLAIVNEVYFKGKGKISEAKNRLKTFINEAPEFFYEFGTRRRRSFEWQRYAISQTGDQILGTSNALLAKEFHLPVIGTMSHQWFMGFQALSRNLRDFQKEALEHWMLTFRDKLRVALTDTVGIKPFIQDFKDDGLINKYFHTLRHDSGTPNYFVDELVRNDIRCNILFSDGLNAKTANQAVKYAFDRGFVSNVAIGTSFTNNWGDEPLQIVIKMIKLNGQPVAKISDTPGKMMSGDDQAVERLRKTFGL